MADLSRVAAMTNDEFLGPWWWGTDDLRAWLRREISEERGPTRAICVADDDRALGRVAVRLPQFASGAVRCAAVQTSDQPAGELSYWLLPYARGRGLAFTAVTKMMEIAVNAGLRWLVLDIEERNVRRGLSVLVGVCAWGWLIARLFGWRSRETVGAGCEGRVACRWRAAR